MFLLDPRFRGDDNRETLVPCFRGDDNRETLVPCFRGDDSGVDLICWDKERSLFIFTGSLIKSGMTKINQALFLCSIARLRFSARMLTIERLLEIML